MDHITFFRVHHKPTIEYWSALAISPALHLFKPKVKHQTAEYEQSTTDLLLQSVAQESISRNIFKDPVTVFFLFQCFQEAQNDQLCEMLSKSLESEIILCNVWLLPYRVTSLGFFLSQSKRNWKVLDLSRCYIEDHGINILHHYLLGYKIRIKSVILIENNLTRTSSPLLCDIISHLQLHELTIDIDEIYMSDIGTAVIGSGTVIKLSLYSRLKCIPAIKLSATSDMIMHLQRLCFSRNIVNDNAAVILSKALAKSKTLKELDLSKNCIGDIGSKAIANSLKHNASLEVLNLAYNFIGITGIIKLSTALLHNCSLKELNIFTRNKDGARGASAIVTSLVHNTSLEVLLMDFDVEGATPISEVITTNKTLKKLYVQLIYARGYMCTDLDEESAIEIIRSLHKNNTLRELGISEWLTKKKKIRSEIEHINSSRSTDQKVTLQPIFMLDDLDFEL